ncbi:MAG: cation-translocating P-type ATPase [Erysipelotrichaceae bacterium]
MRKQDLPMEIAGILLVIHWVNTGLKLGLDTTLLLAIAAIIALFPIVRRAIGALRFGMSSIDLLVSIAVIGALFLREYSEAAIVSFLFLFGAFLESRTIRKTRSAIEALLKLAPSTAMLVKDGKTMEVAIETLVKGDIVAAKTGQRIPVDGLIRHGSAAIDQSQITGEPMPAEKTIGDFVYASTILSNGYIEVETQEVGETTLFGNIVKRLEEAQDKKAQTQRMIEKFAAWYTPSVVVLAILTFILSRNLSLALTLLVIACPGAMVISIPVAIVAGIGTLAKHGILAKGGESIEKLAKIDFIAFDKTGTLTQGKPTVTRIVCIDGNETEILASAVIAEQDSDHALGKAILRRAQEMHIDPDGKAEKVDVLPGKGIRVTGTFGDIVVGNLRLAKESSVDFPPNQLQNYDEMTLENPTSVFVSRNGSLLGYLIISDILRADAEEALRELRRLKVKEIHVITGDSLASANKTMGALPVDAIHADILPLEKAEIVRTLRRRGKVAMVGDGINDTLALSESDAGIALSSQASEVAMKTADLVILGENVSNVATALRISRFSAKILKQNILLSISTVFLLIFGVLIGRIHMDSGMLVHEVSVLAVILNALRILRKK